MKPADAEKLLGGYAAGTLTPEERQALFAAALEDQQLYEALVHEEPLRELLADPAARADLLATLDAVPKPWYYRDVHPGIIAAAVSAVVIVTIGIKFWPVRTAPPISVVAQAELPQPAKSDLPAELPVQGYQAAATQNHALPEPPRIPAAHSVRELAPAVNEVLAQSTARPAPPDVPSRGAATDLADVSSRPQAFARAAIAPATLALRYTILKKLSSGESAPVDPGQELEASDEALIRLEPNESGFLYVLERADSGDWRAIASERVQASAPYTVPKNGTFHAEHSGPREFLVLFSRQPQNVSGGARPVIAAAREQKAVIAGAATDVISTSAAPSAQVSFPITLKWK
jgi:hypothetical protein